MIPLSFGIRPVGLPQNRCDFLCVQIAHGWPVHLLYRDACNLSALRDRQWFAMCDKGEEAVDGSQTTVAGADGYFPVILQVLQEREHLSGFQVGQRQGGDLSTLALRDEEQQQLP
jgi:hypothetical protein